METYISISQLNDFIFCPRSIYYHQIYQSYHSTLYYDRPQIEGETAHLSIENKKYSTKKDVLQSLPVYCERLRLAGKIDLYDRQTETLTERKKKVKKIYDGYIFQLYGQYYALQEMGYSVRNIYLYSMDDNKKHPISLPDEDEMMKINFFNLISQMRNFKLSEPLVISPKKCQRCIYKNLCDLP